MAPGLWSTGSIVVAHSLGCSTAWGNLPGSGIKFMSPVLAGGFFTTEPPGKPLSGFFTLCIFTSLPYGTHGTLAQNESGFLVSVQ